MLEKTLGRDGLERQISRHRTESETEAASGGDNDSQHSAGSLRRRATRHLSGSNSISSHARKESTPSDAVKKPQVIDKDTAKKLIEAEKAETGKVSVQELSFDQINN